MPIARIQLPDGRIARVEVPEGATPQQAEAFARRAAGQQSSTPPARAPAQSQAHRPSMTATAVNSLAAVGGGMFRGAAALPDMMADAGEAVITGLAGLVGHKVPETGRRFRLGDLPDRLGTPRLEAPGAEFAANLLGGLAIPFGPKAAPRLARIPAATAPKPTIAATSARAVVETGRRVGVPVLTSDIKPPRTFVGKIAQATGERVIGTGTGSMRQAQNVKRIQAVEHFVAEYGNPDLMEEVTAVAKNLETTRGAQLSKYTAQKLRAIKGVPGNVPVDRTLTVIDEQIASLRGINESSYAPVIAKLEAFKAELAKGKTLEQIEGNRKILGDMFADPSLAAIRTDGQKALNAIYAPLRAEMGTYIRNRGGARSLANWQAANKRLAALAGELDAKTFKNVLSAADTTPEKVATLIFSKNPSDMQRLATNLSPAGRTRVQAAIVAKAAEGATEQATGVVSPQKFANAMEAMSRNVGMFFDATEQARIEGFTRLIKLTQRASEAALAPPTGVQSAMTGLYGGAGVLGGWGGLLGVQSFGVMARIYESAPIRNMLLGLSKSAPKSKAEAAIVQRLLPQITVIVKEYGTPVMDALGDNSVAQAASAPKRWQNDYAVPDWQSKLTKLTPNEEQQFQDWASKHKAPITDDYDMRGYWKSGDYKQGTSVNPNDNLPHYNDRWKTPLHHSFSGESIYSTPRGPSWNDKDQLVDEQGTVLFDERAKP